MIFICFKTTAFASATEINIANDTSMPNLGIKVNEVSVDTSEEIEKILSKMNNLAIKKNETTQSSIMAASTDDPQLLSIEQEYEKLENQAKELGCIFLTDEQAAKYVYGNTLPEVSPMASISYPDISGIKFAITYYTYNRNKMAKCIATQDPNKTSKLVKNYETVEMYENTVFSSLAGKGIKMTATNLSSYILGELTNGTVSFIVSTLSQLPGTVFPSNSSSSKAKLSLAVSTNSTVVHIWKYVNDNYYFRTASVKAKINETWTLRDVNGNHYTKTHSYTSYSDYYNNNAQAIAVNSYQSYSIYQQYKTQNHSGNYIQKLEVIPFTASLPIHFA